MGYDELLDKEMPQKVWLSYGVCKFVDITGNCLRTLRFREWIELHTFFKGIMTGFKRKVLCFVHNLSYEFDFLIKNLSRPKNFICNSTHNVIASTLEEYRIEFRCTYQLSKLPLRKIGELFNLPKLESDYRDIYPDDEVTEEEWTYCERDCEILIPYVLEELKTYKMLSSLPYTSTGKVRLRLKQLLKTYDNDTWDLMPPSNCFKALNHSFRGGLTMSNPRFTKVKINTRVKSYDEKSKYPSVMLCEKYPRKIQKLEEFNNDTYKGLPFWIGLVRLTNIYSNFEWGCISFNTCEKVDLLNSDIFNGKIVNTSMVEMYITNIDLKAFQEVYHIGGIEFIELYECTEYDYLPEPFIELIKEFAQNKVRIGKELKDVEKTFGENSQEWLEKNREYMESKAMLNGIYGMMVQKLTPQEFYIDDNFLWHEKDNEYKYIEGKHLFRNFLFGIFITAYSRHDLIINIIKNCPTTFVYCDTDSIKFIDTGIEFVDMNKDLPEHLAQLEYFRGFNKFEEEESYDEFLTYGAKKYCYIRKGYFNFVVAGLPKITAISSFEEFRLNTTYKNCKLAKRYIYNNTVTDVDFITNETIRQFKSEVHSAGGVALFETDYKLDMTTADLSFISFNELQWSEKDRRDCLSQYLDRTWQ